MTITPFNPIEHVKAANEMLAMPLPTFDRAWIKRTGSDALYPIATSPMELAHPYPPVTGKIDHDALFLAQQLARFAKHCSPEVAEHHINRANHLLTEAYGGGDEHRDFWEQFHD